MLPSSPITAESDETDLVTVVHWNHSNICAQFQYSTQMCIHAVFGELGYA